MILRQRFEKECEGWKAIANKSVIANYTNEYVHWLESKVEQLQNTSSNSEYMSALKDIEEYKQNTPEEVHSCLGVECFAKQRLNQRSWLHIFSNVRRNTKEVQCGHLFQNTFFLVFFSKRQVH